MKIAGVVLVVMGTAAAIYALVSGMRGIAVAGSFTAAVGLMLNAAAQDRDDGL